MAKFNIKITDNKLAIINAETKDVCVPPIYPSNLEHIVHDLTYNLNKKYSRKDTETHYTLRDGDKEIVHIEKPLRSDLLNFINSLCLIVTNEEIHLV